MSFDSSVRMNVTLKTPNIKNNGGGGGNSGFMMKREKKSENSEFLAESNAEEKCDNILLSIEDESVDDFSVSIEFFARIKKFTGRIIAKLTGKSQNPFKNFS